MKKIILFLTGVSITLCGFAQKFPFPMNESGYSYPYGITPTTPNNEKIQAKFEAWESAMWEESGDYGRIKYDDTQYTVSEGIAYGMLIYVYMANETNSLCQDHFDKLYAYYKQWSNKNNLMNWKIKGFTEVADGGAGGATDADLDVGLALCLAAKQWGESSRFNYALEAETILKSIYSNETFTNNSFQWMKSGDTWNSVGNPCYFTVASLGLYEQAQETLGFSAKKDWAKVHTDCFEYLRISEHNGVWPNWSTWDGTPSWRPWLTDEDVQWDEQNFGWDACRVPWRIAWDYVWFGTQDSKDLAAKTLAMLDAKDWENSPSKIGYLVGLDQDGYENVIVPTSSNPNRSKTYTMGNAAWTGSIACSFMTDNTRQENLDTYYNHVLSRKASPYYEQTLQVLYLLTLSGNAANFYSIDVTDEKDALQTVIAKATFIKEHSTIGSGNGEYSQTVVNALASAIATAQQQYDDAALTTEQANDAIDDLNSAITTFYNSVNVVADKAELKEYIDLVTDFLASTTAGTEVGQYSESKRTTLESKLKVANTQYNKETATQNMVDFALSALKTAYNDYKSSIITSTAIENVDFTLSVYPNPCGDVIFVESTKEIAYVQIFGFNGSTQLCESHQNAVQINISTLKKGVYAMQIVYVDGTKKTTKFIKE